MIYCKRCLYPANHPYGLIFDHEGICSGCRVHEEKDTLDWNERFEILKRIAAINTRNSTGKGFDCIVPVTGGADSYFIVHTVKYVLGMNPLLVNYNTHYNTKLGIRNLANLATIFDCDFIQSTVAPALLKRITRHTLNKFGSMYWHVLAGTLTFPVQAAVKFRTPLIIWGVHPWSDQTGMYSHLDEVEMTERCRVEHGLMGISARDVIDEAAGITATDVLPFTYPDDQHLEAIGVRGIYLSNFLRWDSKAQHEKMIDMYGYQTAPQQRTFNSYEDVHCFHSAGTHDYIKFLKLGYGKVTDHASREIRLGRMTREEGIEMVKRYTEVKPADLPLFLNWIGMSEEEFMNCVQDRRDPAIWENKSDTWHLRDSVTNHPSGEKFPKKENCIFRITPSTEPNAKENEYLLMGRGYIDKYNYGAREDQPAGGSPPPRSFKLPPLVGES